MLRQQVFCGNCAGIGYSITWKAVSCDDISGLMQKETTTCTQCGGKGYTEYAVFSVEEAEAILKHCGLTTES